MGEGSSELWQELSGLADSFSDVGRRLLSASRRLHAPGALPSMELMDEVGRLREAFASARGKTTALARALGVPVREGDALASLKDLAELLDAVSAAEERREEDWGRYRAAIAVLDRVLQLRHVQEAAFPPLAACHDQARALRERLAFGPSAVADPVFDEEVSGLAENDHPFAYLLTMVEGCEGLNDDLWEGLFESVGKAFGRALATAAARTRLVLATAEPVPAVVAEPKADGEADVPVVVAAEAAEADAPLAVDPGLTFDIPPGSIEEAPSPTEPLAPAFAQMNPALAESWHAPASPWGSEELLTTVVSEAFPYLPRGLASMIAARRVARASKRKSVPKVERLETVRLLSCNSISGHVYLDANNNGLLDAGEPPIAGNAIELRNASGVVVGQATTDAAGFYSFSTDATTSTAPRTTPQTVTLGPRPTNFSSPFTFQKFDATLGDLTQVSITINGSLTSTIRAENTSPSAPDTITATVSGDLAVSVSGLTATAPLSSPGGVFNADVYDGTTDFSGPSGVDFGARSAAVNQTTTFSTAQGDDLSGFLGTGAIGGTFSATSTSRAEGGGNVLYSVDSTATATVTVVYTYTPRNCLAPGSYTIVQPVEPPDTLNGRLSSQGVVLPPTAPPDAIPVTLADADSTNNDFGQLRPASIAGFVYVDANNDGVKDSGETGIPGVPVALQGTNDLGQAVSATATTDASGAYAFPNLRPGTYAIDETQPTAFLDGKDTIGTPGGQSANDRFFDISLGQGVAGLNNNFGELVPASLAGFVYHDRNNDGLKDPGEPGIAGTTVALQGTNDLGQPVSATATTDASGAYAFPNLRPGTYAIDETQPTAFLDGKDTIGTPGGQTANDRFFDISLGQGVAGLNNNFGELVPASLAGFVYYDKNNDGVKDPSEPGIAGTTVALQGTNDLGQPVSATATTDASGAYAFPNLRPGTYAIDQTQPVGYLDGKDTIGTPGGLTANDRFSGVVLDPGVDGQNNNFGEVLPGALNGFVYVDDDRNGLKAPGERAIPNVAINLTGVDDLGQPVNATTTTDGAGFYAFTGLRPGTYAVTEPVQPRGFDDGQETRGNITPIPGSKGTDVITDITVVPGATAPNNNFGETVTVIPPSAECDTLATIDDVDRLGIHHQPTRFVLRFNTAVDPASASNVNNYKLVLISRAGRVSRQEIPIRSATYDARTNTVTLVPVNRLNIHLHYQLTVSNIKDLCDQDFDGDKDGRPGGDFVTVLTKRNYPFPLPAGPSKHVLEAASWARKFPRLAAERHASPTRVHPKMNRH